jgi:hypothetical protein
MTDYLTSVYNDAKVPVELVSFDTIEDVNYAWFADPCAICLGVVIKGVSYQIWNDAAIRFFDAMMKYFVG